MKAIPKLQQGGFAGLFANYTPLQGTPTKASQPQTRASAPSSGGGGNDGKLTEKDLFNLMKDVKGLPNDMAALVKNLYEMYTVSVVTGDTQNLAAIYLQNLMQLKTNVYNQKQYDNAYEQVKAQGGLNEYAVTTNGKLVVQDKETKELKFMSMDEIKDSVDNNFSILTNSQLLYLRAHSPSLTNDNTILQTVENGIGMEQVAKMVQERLTALGTDEVEQKGSVTANYPAVAGAEILASLAAQGQEGGWTELKSSQSWEKLTKTQQRQAQSALSWILRSLPDNARTLLTIKAGGEEKATDLVWQLIQSRTSETVHTSSTQEQTWEYHAATGGKGKGKGSGSGDELEDLKLNIASQFLAGYGVREQFLINPGGNSAFAVSANALQLVTKEGESLGAGSTLQDVSKSQYSGILDWGNITMGGRPVKSSVYNQIILDDGMIHSIDFPVMVNESGKIVPDLRPDTLQRKREAERAIKAYGIDLQDPDSIKNNVSQINQIYESYGLGAAYNADGSVNSQEWRRFGVMNAKADGRALGTEFYQNSKLLSPITDDYEVDALIAQLRKDNKDYQFDKDDWGFIEGGHDTFYRGTIWVPLNVNYFASQAGSGSTIEPMQGLIMDARQQGLDRRDQLMQTYNPVGQPR